MKNRTLLQFATVVATLLALGCGSKPTLPPPSPSPDGTLQYQLGREEVDGDLRIVVEIQDTTGARLYREVTSASVAGESVWTARWEGNSQVVLEQRRQGGGKPPRYIITRQNDGSWSGNEVVR